MTATLYEIGTNKLRGQSAVNDSSSFSLPSASAVLCSWAKYFTLCACGHTVERKWSRAALSIAIQSCTFSEVCLHHWNSFPQLIIQAACVNVSVCAGLCGLCVSGAKGSFETDDPNRDTLRMCVRSCFVAWVYTVSCVCVCSKRWLGGVDRVLLLLCSAWWCWRREALDCEGLSERVLLIFH